MPFLLASGWTPDLSGVIIRHLKLNNLELLNSRPRRLSAAQADISSPDTAATASERCQVNGSAHLRYKTNHSWLVLPFASSSRLKV